MAAPEGNKNAEGNKGGGGKSLQDRKLAAEVRSLALEEIKLVLENKIKNTKLFEAILLKLAGTVLPRLNAGRDDDERLIPIEGVNITIRK